MRQPHDALVSEQGPWAPEMVYIYNVFLCSRKHVIKYHRTKASDKKEKTKTTVTNRKRNSRESPCF